VAKKVATRLVVLERLVPVGCPTCRFWSEIVLGDDTGARSRPERCPECGRFVPIKQTIIILGVPIDAV
jgi:hypothetical protein